MTTLPPSNSAARRAGSTIRRFVERECSVDELVEALDVVTAFRDSFSAPLNSVHDQLNSFLDPAEVVGKIAHRLKRVPTIMEKVSKRESKIDLSRMQDLGGCRVVFRKLEDLYFFAEQVRLQWQGHVKRESNYIDVPRESGYRGLHIVVIQDTKLIEIQLRTEMMHEWAQLVEEFSGLTRENFKQDGDHVIQKYMKILSKGYAFTEGTSSVELTSDELDKLSTLREEVRSYLEKLSHELERSTHVSD